MSNKICNLLGIEHPIIQGGMIWCSGWELATTVSNSGGLGLIGAGSMHPETLEIHINKAKKATQKPFGINVPLLYPNIEKIMEIIIREKIKIVFTSAGNPKIWTKQLQSQGIKVVHVVANTKFALKAQEAGVDAIVAEGFEAGGHNGREETTTFTMIPIIKKATNIPLIAAGGIATGKGMLAAMVLGADAVQIGTRFVMSNESSAHKNFKNQIKDIKEGDTKLSLKGLAPVRLIKNKFYMDVEALENKGATSEELATLLGKGRAKKGMFEGDLVEGELEIGQISGLIDEIKPVSEIINEIVSEYKKSIREILQDTKYLV